MTHEEIEEICMDPEFDLYWNGEKGKEFRKAVIDLLYESKQLKKRKTKSYIGLPTSSSFTKIQN